MGQAPSGDRPPPEPNHTDFVLADAHEWGEETRLLFSLADELARGTPAVAVLVGGGQVARSEAFQVVLRKWPLFVITGTGGLADDVADLVTARRSGAMVKQPRVGSRSTRSKCPRSGGSRNDAEKFAFPPRLPALASGTYERMGDGPPR